MGIKGLSKYISTKIPQAVVTIATTQLRGTRVAIDGNGIGYRVMSRAINKLIRKPSTLVPLNTQLLRQSWLDEYFYYLNELVHQQITPVVVLDGMSPPEKHRCQLQRQAGRASQERRLAQAVAALDGSAESRDQYRKAFASAFHVNSEDYQVLETHLLELGVPCIRAAGEGESLCAALCAEQRVVAVVSTDTDLLAMGCPLVLTEISGTECTGWRLDLILKALNLTQDQFRDWCVMAGCDFNSNIPKLAIVRSLSLIQQHQTIEAAVTNCKLNADCLNYVRCRELLGYQPSGLKSYHLRVKPARVALSDLSKAATTLLTSLDQCPAGRSCRIDWSDCE